MAGELVVFFLSAWPVLALPVAIWAVRVLLRAVHRGRWLPLINDCLDGELDAADTARLFEHLKKCPGCAQQFRAYRAIEALGRRYVLERRQP